MENISDRIKTILADELEVDVSDIYDDAKLVDLGLDSLTFLELIAEFKEEFNINIAVNEISEYLKDNPIHTVGELTGYLQKVLSNEVKK